MALIAIPLQFVEGLWFGQKTVRQAVCLEPVSHGFSTIATVIGVQHVMTVPQVRRRQFLDSVRTGWRRIALMLPLRLKESRLSLRHLRFTSPSGQSIGDVD